jgi:hypothetical protein
MTANGQAFCCADILCSAQPGLTPIKVLQLKLITKAEIYSVRRNKGTKTDKRYANRGYVRRPAYQQPLLAAANFRLLIFYSAWIIRLL